MHWNVVNAFQSTSEKVSLADNHEIILNSQAKKRYAMTKYHV